MVLRRTFGPKRKEITGIGRLHKVKVKLFL
jgi:hypothetical protein